MKPSLFAKVLTATEHNAQMNKQSLQAKIFSGVTHFRKTHLNRHEVVMTMQWSTLFVKIMSINLL